MSQDNTPQGQVPEALYASAMGFAAEKASVAYVQRKTGCSWTEAEQMLEQMVREGIIETYNGRNAAQVAALTQPAVPSAVESNTAGAALPSDDTVFLSGKAAGRQEVKDEQQTPDFATWIRQAYREPESTSFTIHNMEVAYQAGVASHGQAPAGAAQPIACSYGDNGYACCEGGPCRADLHNESLPLAQAAPAAGAVAPADWPTDAMIEAGRKAAATHGPLLGNGQSLWHVFRDMLAAAPTPAAQADSGVLKDHQIAALVNELRDIAVKFHGTQQLRERIAHVVVPALRAGADNGVQEDAARWCSNCGEGVTSFCRSKTVGECPMKLERAARATGAKP